MRQRAFLALGLAIAAVAFSVSTSDAQVQTFVREYTHRASDADSKITARAIALDQAKRLLLEEVATYVQSSILVDTREVLIDGKSVSLQKLQGQNMTTLAAGFTQAKVLDERWDGKEYWLQVEIRVDPEATRQQLARLALELSTKSAGGSSVAQSGDAAAPASIVRASPPAIFRSRKYGPDASAPVNGSQAVVVELTVPMQAICEFVDTRWETAIVLYTASEIPAFAGECRNYVINGANVWERREHGSFRLPPGRYVITTWSKKSPPDPNRPWQQIPHKVLERAGEAALRVGHFDGGGVADYDDAIVAFVRSY